MAEIRIVISKDGKTINSEVNGIKGEKCKHVDGWLGSLGAIKYTKTGEFFEKEQDNDVNIVGQN